jgi:SulP family sulfate permease
LEEDISGGLTAGIVALPLALAFGGAILIRSRGGMNAAIAMGIFVSLFGGTKTQIIGPTGPITMVTTMVVEQAI